MSKLFTAMIEVQVDPSLINDFTGMEESEGFTYFCDQMHDIFSEMNQPGDGMRVAFLRDTAKIVEVLDSAADKQD